MALELYDRLCQGVYIVTAIDGDQRRGLAVAWGTQISTDRVLIAVGQQSSTREFIERSKAFGLSMLEEGQQEIGRTFGCNSSLKIDKFAGLEWETHETGCPILVDCPLWLDCRVTHSFGVEGQRLFVGEIVAEGRRKESFTPLVYRASEY